MRNCILVCWMVWLSPLVMPAQNFAGDSLAYFGAQGFPAMGLQWAYRNQSSFQMFDLQDRANIQLQIAWQYILLNAPGQTIQWGLKAIETSPTPESHAIFAVVLAKLAWEKQELSTSLKLSAHPELPRLLPPLWESNRKMLWANATRRLHGFKALKDTLAIWQADPALQADLALHLQAEKVRGILGTENLDTLQGEAQYLSRLRKEYQGPIEPLLFSLLVEKTVEDQLTTPQQTADLTLAAADLFLECDYYAGVGKFALSMACTDLEILQDWEQEAILLEKWERKALQFQDRKGMANVLNRRGTMRYHQENMYAALANHQAAKQYWDKANQTEVMQRVDTLTLASIYNNLGSAFGGMQQSDSSLRYLQLAESLYRQIESNGQLATLYFNIGVSYLNESQYDSALTNFSKAESLGATNTASAEGIDLRIALAISHIRLGQLPEALIHLAQLQAMEASVPHFRYIMGWAMAEYAVAEGNSAEAIQQVRHARTSGKKMTRERLLPLLELEIKAREGALPEKDAPFYRAILELCEEAFIEEESISSDGDVGFNQLMKMPSQDFFAQRGIEACLYFHQVDKAPHWLEKAFIFSEKARARFLNHTIRDQRALIAGGVPLDTIRRKCDLEKWIAQQEALATLQQTDYLGADSLHRLQEDLNNLKERIEAQFPEYSRLMNIPPYPSVDTLQHYAREAQTVIIEYFQAEKDLHIFLISPDTFLIHTQPLPDSFTVWVEAYARLVNRAPSEAKIISPYFQISQELYQVLVAPISGYLPKKVTLIPHRSISRISFGTLIQPQLQVRWLKDCKFLVEQYQFSIHYSCQWLMANQMHISGTKTYDYIGFAPVRYPSSDFDELPGALEGMVHMQKTYRRSRIFLYENSNTTNFLSHISQARIIDIATHSALNTSNPLQTSLLLHGQDQITLADLYMSNINAEMANLQACRTGLGKPIDGEGFLSLAWGFANAGCKSILMSLWDVTDGQSTPQIMQLFYEGLAEGKPKDEALTHSIQEFLKDMRAKQGRYIDFSHPYYWGELVLVGDTENIRLRRKFGYGWQIGALALVLGLILVIASRKNRWRNIQSHP